MIKKSTALRAGLHAETLSFELDGQTHTFQSAVPNAWDCFNLQN